MKTNSFSSRILTKPNINRIIILLVSISQFQFAQWTQNTGIEGGDIRAIVYDGSKIYAGLYGGGIYTSDDNVISWERINNGLSNYYVSSLVVKEQYIFAGTLSVGVFVSTNQGQSWVGANNGLPSSSVTAMAELDTFIFTGMINQIYASTDFGQNWFWRSNGLSTNRINSFATKDSLIFVGTEDGFYFSSDYGENWIDRSNGLGNMSINDLTIIDDKIFAATSYGGVFVTYDVGLQWLPAGLSPINILSITSVDTLLFAGTFSSGIFTSSDFGNNWFSFNESYPYGSLTYELEHIGNSIFAGNESGIFELRLGELEWNKRNSGICAVNPECIVVNDNKLYVGVPGAMIYISSDKGYTWQTSKVSESFGSIIDIAFKGDTIYAADGASVYFSLDSGITWNFTPFFAIQLSSMEITEGKIFVGAQTGFWISSDGGWTWEQKNNGLTEEYINELAYDSLNIYAGTIGGLFISSDFGENWTKATSGISQNIFVFAISVIEENIFAGGIYGIYLSTNNGATWSFRGLPNLLVQCISGYDNFIFAGTTPINGIYRSTNSGYFWLEFNDGLPYKDAISIEVLDSTLFAGIWGFGLWNRPIIVTSIEAEQSQVPNEFLLTQNYPNPFNPSTTIVYQIPEMTFVIIKVYDILGNELRTLVDEEKSAGIYKINFEAGNLPSGVYFYRYQAGNFIDTKKMLLLR